MSISSIARSGMTSAYASMEAAGQGIAGRGLQTQATSQTIDPATSPMPSYAVGDSIVADVVGLLQSKNAFLANLSVFKTADAMAGSLLDMTQ
jgi:hypothetical protein